MGLHLDLGGSDALPGGVCQIAVASGGGPAQADVDQRRASVDTDPRSDPVGVDVKTPAGQIARMWLTDDSHVRKVIHEFNEQGFDSLRPDYRGGRPRRITPGQRQRAVAVAVPAPTPKGCR